MYTIPRFDTDRELELMEELILEIERALDTEH